MEKIDREGLKRFFAARESIRSNGGKILYGEELEPVLSACEKIIFGKVNPVELGAAADRLRDMLAHVRLYNDHEWAIETVLKHLDSK